MRHLALIGGCFIAGLVGLVMLAGVFAGHLKDEGAPVEVRVQSAQPVPTHTPLPEQVGAEVLGVRLTYRTGTVGVVDWDFQRGGTPFTEADFIGVAGVVALGNVIKPLKCKPVEGPDLVRFALAWPVEWGRPAFLYVGDGGAEWLGGGAPVLVDQREPDAADASQPGVLLELEIGGNEYNLAVSGERQDCKLFQGYNWQLHN